MSYIRVHIRFVKYPKMDIFTVDGLSAKGYA